MAKFTFLTDLIKPALTISLVSCFIVAIMVALILWPRFAELKTTQKDVEGKTNELQMREEYISELNKIKAELEQYSSEVSKTVSALPADPSLPSLFNFLQESSSKSGLVLKTINPFLVSVSKNLPNFRETTFNIGVAGSYSAFKNFLSTLEKSARMIEVENISFSASTGKEPFDFNLQIKVYSY